MARSSKSPNRIPLTTFHVFDGIDANSPQGSVVEGPAGKFYGKTSNGGDFSCNPYGSCGTVFRITGAGKLTLRHDAQSLQQSPKSVLRTQLGQGSAKTVLTCD
jgi:hypothetical protein